jgi:hypothetical protein
MHFNDDEHEMDMMEPDVIEYIKVLHWARFCLLDYAINNFGHYLHNQSGCRADMIHGFFPDRIDLNSISTGSHSTFLSLFDAWVNYTNSN